MRKTSVVLLWIVFLLSLVGCSDTDSDISTSISYSQSLYTPVISATPTPYAPPTPVPSPTPTPYVSPTPTPIVNGARGNDVAALQTQLNALGYPAGQADGIFGKNTETALKSFQMAYGLEVTGQADYVTVTALSRAYAACTPNPTQIATPQPTAKSTPRPTEKQETMVWIPRSGSCYHSSSSCSNMKNPTKVTLSDAKSMGYRPCKKCY